MLTAAANEMLTRMGPGTPMGNLMREYWLPAPALSSELPTPTASRCGSCCSASS